MASHIGKAWAQAALAMLIVPMVLAGAPAQAAQAQQRINWKVPIAFSSKLQALGDTLPWVSQRLEEISGGNIKLEVFEPGTVTSGTEIFNAVSTGRTEAGYTWMGYELRQVPATVLFGAVPFGMDPWEYMAWFYFGGGKELAREVWAPHDITSLDQLKGLKIRFAGLGGKVLEKLGSTVAVMPAGELRQALDRGIIDATEFSIPSADEQLGFYKVAKYNYFPGWHQPFTAQALYVNKKAWDKVSSPTQALIETTCMAGVTYALAKSESLQGDVIKRYREAGVTTIELSPEMLATLHRTTDEVLAEESARDALFKRVLDSQRAFDAVYRPWQNLAYLRPGGG